MNRKNIFKYYKKHFPGVLQLIIVLFFLTSCKREIPFEKNRWDETTDPAFPSEYRPQMLNDLVTKHKLTGLSYKQLIKLLGSPENEETNLIVYKIIIDYGMDIDPVYSEDLLFTYSKDSIITSFHIREWKK